MSDSLSDYFAQLGININTGDFSGSDGLARAVAAAQQGMVGNRQADVAAMPMITPTGAATRSPFGSYWSVPTATGTVYLRPDTWTAPQNVNSSAFQDSLKAGGSAYTARGNGGSYIADSPGSYSARFSGNLPGIDPAFMGDNPESSWSVWNQAPTERFVQDVPDETMLQAFMQGPAIPLGAFLTAGAIGTGGLGNFFSSFGSGGSLFPGEAVIGSAGNAYGGSLAGLTDAPWGVNPKSGGNMDWWDSFINSVGDAYQPNVTDAFSGGTVPSSYGASGYPSVGAFSNGPTAVNPLNYLQNTPVIWDGITKSTIPGLLGNFNPMSLLSGGSGQGGFSGLGALLGGLLGSSNGSRPAGNVTTTEDIPDWQKSFIIPAISGASNLLQSQTQQSKPLLAPAQAELEKTIKGDYINANPYLDKTFQLGADQIRQQLSPTFGHMQAFGDNSGWQQAFGKSLGDFATKLYGDNYQQERGRQLNAAGMAPTYTSQFSSTQWDPFKNFMSVAGGKFGGQSSQPYFTNPFGGAMSGAMLGGRLFGG